MAYCTTDHTTPIAVLDQMIADMETSHRNAEARYCDGVSDEGGMSFIMGRGASMLRMQREINAQGGTLIKVLALIDGTPVQAEPVVDGFGKNQWRTTKPVNGRRYFPYHPARASTLAKYGLQEVEAIVPTDVTLSQTYCPIDRPCYLKWGA